MVCAYESDTPLCMNSDVYQTRSREHERDARTVNSLSKKVVHI